ncbi:hypothetical protein [Burkholderia mayonis]|uniref:hypothetical protein n=1 Tax=Burkholderia mayonis TaxID=1385591 RepID=UPI000AA83BEA|nr:hypothetical protein [Burkholderia mayonis]
MSFGFDGAAGPPLSRPLVTTPRGYFLSDEYDGIARREVRRIRRRSADSIEFISGSHVFLHLELIFHYRSANIVAYFFDIDLTLFDNGQPKQTSHRAHWAWSTRLGNFI